MPLNRIVTRGLGPSRGLAGRAGLVTQGYGGVPLFVVQALSKPRDKHGRSSKRVQDDLEIITLWAKLIEVNSKAPKRKVEGTVRIPIKKSLISVTIKRLASKVSNIIDRVKVTAKRIK